MEEQRDLKALKLLGDRAEALETEHAGIGSDLQAIKARVKARQRTETTPESLAESKQAHLERMSTRTPLPDSDVDELYREAEAAFPGEMTARDLLTATDRRTVDARVERHVDDFNARFGLDRWDYAIAGASGLVGAMFDLLCVAAPAAPKTAWSEKVDGIFNQAVQQAFNALLPPEVSAALGEANKIGSADASTIRPTGGSPARLAEPHEPPAACLVPRSRAGVPIRGAGHDAWHMHGRWERRDQDTGRWQGSDGDRRLRGLGAHVRTPGVRRERSVGHGQ